MAIGGLLIRLVSLTGPGGPLDTPGGYDDSVYFASSALLFRGVLPYRDFVLVHPPGAIYLYGLVSAWRFDPASLFAAARLFATVIGAINIFLVGRITMRAAGPIGGLVAATLYAIYPEAISAERGPYLEPVLNLACLSMAWVWLRRTPNAIHAGALCGFACATKVLGGIWFLAALASAQSRRDIPRFIAAAAATGFALLAPLALPNVRAFVEQTVRFHMARPPDGIGEPLVRLREMLLGSHPLTSALAIIALLSLFIRPTRELRFFAVAHLLTIAALLASSTYWPEYNAHLAASQCVLAGLALAGSDPKSRVIPLLIALAIVGFNWRPLRQLLSNSRTRAPQILTVGKEIRERVPAGDCVFSFDPSWALAGGRLPPYGDGAPVIVDSYADRDVARRLAACRFVIVGERGQWEMNEETRKWFAANFVCRTPDAGELCLWERR